MISVGIDVSKGESTVCVMKPGGEVLKPPFKMLHSIEGILYLCNLITSYDEETRVVLEDTGHYHLPVVTLLVEKGIFVCTVNALRMKKFCSQSIRRAKTDKIDSVHIASYGLTYWNELTPVMPPKDVYRELKLLVHIKIAPSYVILDCRTDVMRTGIVAVVTVTPPKRIGTYMVKVNTSSSVSSSRKSMCGFVMRYFSVPSVSIS